MEYRFAKLTRQEAAACLIAERVLGAVAEQWDVDGRQGAVDARLTLADGRIAAFEVTAHAADGALQADALLGRDDNQWPLPGEWWWSVKVGSVRDIPRLKKIYEAAALRCEANGVTRPEELRRRLLVPDPDVDWLVKESSSTMFGHPEVPARDGDKVRSAMVVTAGRGGGVDQSLNGLSVALAEAFQEPNLARHLRKVANAGCDERHLFIPIHLSALPFAVLDGLATGDRLPPDPPPLPVDMTHLWLAPPFSRRVLLWGPDGWQQHHPYENDTSSPRAGPEL